TSVVDRGLTSKSLYELEGGHSVEAVVMRYTDRTTLCISSQAGCPIGCPFCATGKFPFGRNLMAHEIVEQAVDAQRILSPEGRRLSHVVFMGMGEPMANYQAVVDSVRRIADPELLGISPRRIVVSTSGLIPRIAQLGEEKIPDTPYNAPDRASIRAFRDMVEAEGLNVTVRDTRGREADAACGQLHERVMRATTPVA